MKKWHWISAFFLCCLLSSCSTEESAPELPIPQDKLVPVLADAYVAEAAINSLVGSIRDSMATVYYEQICTIHGIQRTDFENTISIMQQHPNFMDSVYANVLQHLVELE